MLFEPNHTPYDLRFQIFRIPVRVHPMFWLMAVLFGWTWLRTPGYGFPYLLLWVACVFLSILLHEIGHVIAGRWFGSQGHIVLFHFGGLAIGSRNAPERWQRIVVSFAGPAAQFLLLIPVWLATPYILQATPVKLLRMMAAFLSMLYFINLYWPLLNLLPIWPLDGGQISRELCLGASRDRGLVISLGISGVVAGVLALNSLMAYSGRPLIPYVPSGGLYLIVLFALFSVQSFMALNEANKRNRWDDRMPWE